MKVAVFGAGALGCVYGVRLALRAKVDVVFVVRPSRVASKDPIAIETARKNKHEEIEEPERVDVVPADADVVLLAVGTEDLESLKGPLALSNAPIIVLTPMLPKDWARVRATFGERVFAAMPSVVAYTRKEESGQDVVRYWTPPAPTRIDEPRADNPHKEIVRELASTLTRAGLNGKLELGVHEKNPATTVCFIAIGMIISLAGSVAALAEDEALVSLASHACREGVRLSHRIGEPEMFARLAPAISAPWAFRLWLNALQLAPEALFYAEEHFGRKLKEQHRVMIREMIDLAEEKGLPHEALDDLAARLERNAATTSSSTSSSHDAVTPPSPSS